MKELEKIKKARYIEFTIDEILDCCEIEMGEDKPFIKYSGNKLKEVIDRLQNGLLLEIIVGGNIVFSGTDFDGVDTVTLMYKGEFAKRIRGIYEKEIKQLRKEIKLKSK